MKLSIIIPVYNEEESLKKVVEQVQESFKNYDYEIIVIDDGCTDDSFKDVSIFKRENIIVLHHKYNKGKGGALITGIRHATGEFITIQDADLEYNPNTLLKLWKTIVDKNTVIYGKRSRDKGYILNRLANFILSTACNFLYKSNLYDIYTCYKIVPKDFIEKFNLTSNGFEIEAEITAKLLKNKANIIEIPIDYKPRLRREGKKIKFKDGFIGLWTLLKCRFTS